MFIARLVLTAILIALPAAAAQFATWPVDALVKVFPQDAPGANRSPATPTLIARNGHATVQFAIRSDERLKKFNVTLTAPPALQCQFRHVGYVPVDTNPPGTPVDELLRLAPSFFPDPLLETFPYTLFAHRTEAIWITAFAPASTAPGLYSGKITFENEGRQLAAESFTIRVTSATVPATQTLKVTNWLSLSAANLARFYKLDGEDAHYWQLLANIARLMADHKQNVILTPVRALATPSIQNGKIIYDFSRLDRWVQLFDAAGIHTIEGSHLLGRLGGYDTPMCIPADVIENGQIVSKSLATDDPRAAEHLNNFLPALYTHIRRKGWQNRYLQHIHDEPHGNETAVYRRYAALIRKNLPGIPTLDAISLDRDTSFLDGMVDVWVPILGSFDTRMDQIRAHTAQGGQCWFYTCIYPQGRYLNRFTDLPLLKTRLLHWFNYRHNLTGFLHWGGNYWTQSPFDNVQPVINEGTTLLPAGDNAIIYPSPDNYTALSSVRLEAMRDGLEDYELLAALARQNPEKARQLAQTAIPNFTDYVRDVSAFRKLQAELLAD
ncbi:MAG: DUF4091 domain-containing protein [Bryobacterales bacterium]|nr:DUF4091 domain-containing protein [Bryobacterales bacterium]